MHLRATLLIFLWISPCLLSAQVDEKERLSGFAEHYKGNSQHDREREKGIKDHRRELDAWDSEREKARFDHKKERKSSEMTEEGPEAKADLREKATYTKEIETARRDYVSKKSRQDNFSRKALKFPSEEEELGLIEDRPRVDYKKRATYGAQPNYSKMPVSGSSPSRGGGSGRFGGGGGESFPPPPAMDYDDSYVPAPGFDREGDVEPPPAPPFPEDFEDMGPEGGADDFIPPPPPPPPGFGDVEIDPIEPEY